MFLVFLIFIIVGILGVYAVWFTKQDGKKMGRVEQVVATVFLLPFVGIGLWGFYIFYIYVPAPTTPVKLAGEIVAWFDANKDKQIDIRRESSVIRCKDELSCHTYGYGELFRASDKDKNETTTPEELTALLASFDANKDGKLDFSQELALFHQKFPRSMSNGFRKERTKQKMEPLVE